MKALWNRLSVGGKLCLFVIAAYFLCAAWGGIRSLNALEQELAEMKRRITVLQRQPDGSLAEEEMEESL